MKKNASRTTMSLIALSIFSVFTPMTKATAISTSPALYAGGSNPGVVYRYVGGTQWDAISQQLGYAVLCIVEYKGKLFAGTMSTSDPKSGVGKVYQYDGDTTWTLVGDNMDDQVCCLVVFRGNLYAGTAWGSGRLYRYNCSNDWTVVIDYGAWSGFRSAYVWNSILYLGDIGNDLIGHYDSTSFHYDQNIPNGSCIYDFQEYKGSLYASAYNGRLHTSSNGVNWTNSLPFHDGNLWELEAFQDNLYMGYNSGELWKYDGNNTSTVWTASGSIISMTTDDSKLYFGIGGEAGGYYGSSTSGTGQVYSYDGNQQPQLISGSLGTGAQALYLVKNPSWPFILPMLIALAITAATILIYVIAISMKKKRQLVRV